MKVACQFELEAQESKDIREALEKIPTDLCRFINCPEIADNICDCDNCPMLELNRWWEEMHNSIHEELIPMLEKLEPKKESPHGKVGISSCGSIGGQMVRKMIEAYEEKNR